MYYSDHEAQILTGFLSEFFIYGNVDDHVRSRYQQICQRVANKTMVSADLQSISGALEFVLSAVELSHESYREALGLLVRTRQMTQEQTQDSSPRRLQEHL